MTRRGGVPKVDGLEEWELGLFMELRTLKEADVLAPVIEVMAACLEALYVEAERQAWQRKEKRREEESGRQVKRYLSKPFQKSYIPIKFKPDNLFIRKLIAEQTAAGQWASRLDRDLRRDITRSMIEESQGRVGGHEGARYGSMMQRATTSGSDLPNLATAIVAKSRKSVKDVC